MSIWKRLFGKRVEASLERPRSSLQRRDPNRQGAFVEGMQHTCGYCFCHEQEATATAFFEQVVQMIREAKRKGSPSGHKFAYDVAITQTESSLYSPFTVLVATSGAVDPRDLDYIELINAICDADSTAGDMEVFWEEKLKGFFKGTGHRVVRREHFDAE